ncbi:MAG: hypothetical protein ACD_79C01449G0007, partial [uncultured bacterium]
MVEYIIIVCLIALSAIVIVSLFGHQGKKQFSSMTKALSGENAEVDATPAADAQKEEDIDPSLKEYRVELENQANDNSNTNANVIYETTFNTTRGNNR